MIRTDWDLQFGHEHYKSRFPRIHVDAADWLARRGIWLVGVEHPSVAAPGNIRVLTEVHHAFRERAVVVVEGLANIQELPEQVMFVALPLKIVGGEGTPTQAAGIVT